MQTAASLLSLPIEPPVTAPLALSSTIDLKRLDEVLHRFVAWLQGFGETSFDHQTFFAGPVGGAAKALYYRRPWIGTLAVAPSIVFEAFLPAARQLYWHKQRFPIADAHYAMGFAMMARWATSPAYRERAAHFLRVLEHTRSPGYEHHAWGYPFDWVTRTGVMCAGTPLITTTPYVYEAFDAMYRLGGDAHWRDVMLSIAEHALRDFKDIDLDGDAASAGYNPHDLHGRVVNASAYRACLLTSAAREFGRDDFRYAAQRNLSYVLQSQRPDGSWFYATDGVRDFIDHFHTCFVLKALVKIEALTGQQACSRAIESGVRYYVENLFDEDGLPRPFAHAPRVTVYKHELYDYAECVNLWVLLAGRFPTLDARVQSTLADLFSQWLKADGSFRSRRLMFGWDNVPMHRWAQSQMFRSLCALRLALTTKAGT